MEGWNDPPKNVGMPTGNLKINLNKRVAFPLSSASATQNSSACPLLLPPKPPAEGSSVLQSDDSKEVQATSADLSLQRDNVLRILTKEIAELNASIQSTVSTKLKTLDDDWDTLDIEILKLLVELSQNLESKDSKSASAVHRKIVMKGCSRPWLHAIRQIIMNIETAANVDINLTPQNVLPSAE